MSVSVCECVRVCVRVHAVLLGDSDGGERTWGYTGGWSVEQQASQQTAQDTCNKNVQSGRLL